MKYNVDFKGNFAVISRDGFMARVYGSSFKRRDAYDGIMPAKAGYVVIQGQPNDSDMDMIRKYQSMVF